MDGTDQIASQFAVDATRGVAFAMPGNVTAGWLPKGYRLVTDPVHVVLGSDCVLPHLGTDWRLVSEVNAGSRAGLCANDVGNDIRYVATKV